MSDLNVCMCVYESTRADLPIHRVTLGAIGLDAKNDGIGLPEPRCFPLTKFDSDMYVYICGICRVAVNG